MQDDPNTLKTQRLLSEPTLHATPNVKLVASEDQQDQPQQYELSQTTPQEFLTTAQKYPNRLIGSKLDERYQLLALIGAGATTSVYKAVDTDQDRLVAIKMLRKEHATNDYTISRFADECKTLKLLHHNNIVNYLGYGVLVTADANQPYLVTEYLEGSTLKHLLETEKSLSIERTVYIFAQVCAAMTTAHAKGIVHRDLKPANVMIVKSESGEEIVKLLDFGVSKVLPIQGETFQTRTQTGEMFGTLLYMSPEQCLEQDVDARSDIYSMGCMMFEVLTGTPPFLARTAFETMNKQLTQKPDSLSVIRPDVVWPAALDRIIQKMVEKKPENRYQTTTQLQTDLLDYSKGQVNFVFNQKADLQRSSAPTTKKIIRQIFIFLVLSPILFAAFLVTLHFLDPKFFGTISKNVLIYIFLLGLMVIVASTYMTTLITFLGRDNLHFTSEKLRLPISYSTVEPTLPYGFKYFRNLILVATIAVLIFLSPVFLMSGCYPFMHGKNEAPSSKHVVKENSKPAAKHVHQH
jgi:serine/threonine protein kinase